MQSNVPTADAVSKVTDIIQENLTEVCKEYVVFDNRGYLGRDTKLMVKMRDMLGEVGYDTPLILLEHMIQWEAVKQIARKG